MHTNTFRLRTHCLITGANLVKTITELIESSLVDECIKHAHTNTHPHTEDESLQGHGYLLSHFSYHLGFVNSQWGGNAISGAAHSSLRLVKEKKKPQERERERKPTFLQSIIHDKVAAPRGDVEREAYILQPFPDYDSCMSFFIR